MGGTDTIVKPTLAWYRPVEGGDYVVAGTVKELVRRVAVDVVVPCCVHLAVGSVGRFGLGASFLSARTFTDYLCATQPQVYPNCPIIVFPGILDWPQRETTLSPKPITRRPYDRPPRGTPYRRKSSRWPEDRWTPRPNSSFDDLIIVAPPPPPEGTDPSTHSYTDSSTLPGKLRMCT